MLTLQTNVNSHIHLSDTESFDTAEIGGNTYLFTTGNAAGNYGISVFEVDVP